MKRAYPAFCPAGEGFFSSLDAAVAHYVSKGFKPFDSDDGWRLLRNGAFEAYVRRHNAIEWRGTVVQLHATGCAA